MQSYINNPSANPHLLPKNKRFANEDEQSGEEDVDNDDDDDGEDYHGNNENKNHHQYENNDTHEDEYYDDDEETMLLSSRSWPDDGDHCYFERQTWESPFYDVQFLQKSASENLLLNQQSEDEEEEGDEFLQQQQQQQYQQQQQQQQYNDRIDLQQQQQHNDQQHFYAHQVQSKRNEQMEDQSNRSKSCDSRISPTESTPQSFRFMLQSNLRESIRGLCEKVQLFVRMCSSILGFECGQPEYASSSDFHAHFTHYNHSLEISKASLFAKCVFAFLVLQLFFEAYLFKSLCTSSDNSISFLAFAHAGLPSSTSNSNQLFDGILTPENLKQTNSMHNSKNYYSDHSSSKIGQYQEVEDGKYSDCHASNPQKLSFASQQNCQSSNRNHSTPAQGHSEGSSASSPSLDWVVQCKSPLALLRGSLNAKLLVLGGLCILIWFIKNRHFIFRFTNNFTQALRGIVLVMFLLLLLSIPDPESLLLHSTSLDEKDVLSLSKSAIVNSNCTAIKYSISFRLFLPIGILNYSVKPKILSVVLLAFLLMHSSITLCRSHGFNYIVAGILSVLGFGVSVWRIEWKESQNRDRFYQTRYRIVQEYNKQALQVIYDETREKGKSSNRLNELSTNVKNLLTSKRRRVQNYFEQQLIERNRILDRIRRVFCLLFRRNTADTIQEQPSATPPSCSDQSPKHH